MQEALHFLHELPFASLLLLRSFPSLEPNPANLRGALLQFVKKNAENEKGIHMFSNKSRMHMTSWHLPTMCVCGDACFGVT